ncbi:MAG: putative flavoprotein involved in K+ transport [Moritella dasanensis]|jgi:putative flavoprotein involved in K+ transport
MQSFDIIIIGAGQYGLYTAKKLADKKIDHQVIDAGRVGDVWRNRLHTMKLFTSRQYSSLPGLSFPGKQSGFPSVVEMGDYLETYARKFNLNIRQNSSVESLTKENDLFVIKLKNGDQIQAKVVINATGANQECIIPDIAIDLSDQVTQLTADRYDFDDLLSNQRVLVVGGGASGRQISALLNEKGHQVTLSCTGTRTYPPKKILRKDFFFWLKLFNVIYADRESFIAKIIQKRNPVPCGDLKDKHLNRLGIKVVAKATSCLDNRVTFESGEQVQIDVIIWSVGYKDKTQWLGLDNCILNGEFIHDYGETPEPGLFIVGRKWLSCRASELIMGVDKDVNLVVGKLTNYLRNKHNV